MTLDESAWNSIATRLRQWGPKAFFSLADQGLFSIATFLLNVLLARWLAPEDYGAFAVAFSIFLFLGALHTALLTEPMLVLGAARFRKQFRGYLSFLLTWHIAISLAGGLLLALAARLLAANGSAATAEALLGVALAAPLMLLPWLLRRAFYVEMGPRWAALGSAIYLALLTAGLFALRSAELFSPFTAYLTMGAASLLVSGLFLWLLKPARLDAKDRTEMLARQWEYGRWSSLSAVLVWAPLNIFYVAIPYVSGLASAGALRALSNLLTPLTQGTQALIVLLLPQLAQLHQEQGSAALIKRVRAILFAFLALSGLYWLALAAFRYELIGLLYADRYADFAALLPLAGLVPAAMGASSVLGSGLRAMEQPRRVVIPYALGAAFALSAGIWFTLRLDVAGALIGQALTYLLMALLLGWQFMRAPKP